MLIKSIQKKAKISTESGKNQYSSKSNKYSRINGLQVFHVNFTLIYPFKQAYGIGEVFPSRSPKVKVKRLLNKLGVLSAPSET